MCICKFRSFVFPSMYVRVCKNMTFMLRHASDRPSNYGNNYGSLLAGIQRRLPARTMTNGKKKREEI